MTFKVSEHVKEPSKGESAARKNAEVRIAINNLVYSVTEEGSAPDMRTLKVLANRFTQILCDVKELEAQKSTSKSVAKIQQLVAKNLGFTGIRGGIKNRTGLELARAYHHLLRDHKPEEAKRILLDQKKAGTRRTIERSYRSYKTTVLVEEVIRQGETHNCDTEK